MATKKWEEGIDYSVEIEKAKAAGLDTTALEEARAAKIADKYGGVEPTMYGSNQTYSQASTSGNSSAISNAVNLYNQYTGKTSTTNKTTTTKDSYAGTNYHQDAIDAAIAGDWDAVVDALNSRETKVSATGQNYGKTSAQIYSELWDLYGQKKSEIPEYDSQYSSQIDQLLDSILNREEFSYDHMTDPSYQAYADQYKRLGDRAREDTLGNIAAMNGGYASSWAASAASQAQNDYNQQLSDIIPTLYEAAYNRYMDDYNMDVTNLGLLQGMDNTYYDRYRDTVSDSQWEQEFDYKKEQDKIANDQWEQTFDWNKTVDQWNMSNTEATQKFDQLMSKWQLTGVADAEVAAALGVPVGATTESYYFNKASLALDQAKLAQSNATKNKEQAAIDKDKSIIVNDIVRAAKNAIETGADSYYSGAETIFDLMYEYNADGAGLTRSDYYDIAAQAGIPSYIIDDAYSDMMRENQGGDEPTTKDYLYYASLMGQQSDPEAWLESNKWTIPADILKALRENFIDY